MSNSCKSDTIFVKMENFEGFDDKCINCLCKKTEKNRGDSGRSPCLLMVRNIYNCLFGLLFVFQ